jgi:hypothetical protein
LLSQTVAETACWQKQPSILQSIGEIAGSIAAVGATAGVALPLAAGIDLIGTATEYARKKKIANQINAVSKGVARAILVDELRLDGELISRSGAELRGHVTSATQDRILISFNLLEAITGDKFSVAAEAVDMGDEMQGIAPSVAKKKSVECGAQGCV